MHAPHRPLVRRVAAFAAGLALLPFLAGPARAEDGEGADSPEAVQAKIKAQMEKIIRLMRENQQALLEASLGSGKKPKGAEVEPPETPALLAHAQGESPQALQCYLLFWLPLHHHANDPPMLILTDRTGLDELNPIPDFAHVALVMSLQLGQPTKHLLVDGVDHRTLDGNDDGLVHFVADDIAVPLTARLLSIIHVYLLSYLTPAAPIRPSADFR